jgi:predicted transcriptional regulator
MQPRFRIAKRMGNLAFVVFESIAEHGDSTVREIMDNTSVSQRSLQRVLNMMVEVNLLTKTKINNTTGFHHSYRAVRCTEWRLP